ncbi:MAG: response regulator [SAR324 cluster bacterium]|nr:response regulator [SAR324 cluster bacterium]
MLLLIVIFLERFSQAETVLAIDPLTGKYELGPWLEFMEDPDGTLTIDQLRSSEFEDKFILNTVSIPNFAYSKSVYWMRLTIENPESEEVERYLELAFPLHDYLDAWIPEKDHTYRLIQTGDRRPFANRGIFHRNFLFLLHFSPREKSTIYLRFQTYDGLHEAIPLILWNPEKYIQNNMWQNFILGLYYGLMGVMALYNLFIFFSVRDLSYLYYVLYILSLILWTFSFHGYAFPLFWPDSPDWFNNVLIWSTTSIALFVALFSRSFLKTSQYTPQIHKFLFVWAVSILFTAIITLSLSKYSWFFFGLTVLVFIGAILIITAGIRCWLKGNRSAWYFLLAWGSLILGTILFFLKIAGILTSSILIENSVQVGSAIEVVLLSLGLADRINQERKEKYVAQQAAAQAQQEALEAERQIVENLKNVDRLKDEFLANTSHELRTPLNGIIGLAESLLDGSAGKLPQLANNNLIMIAQSGKRLSNLVNDILDFSKMKNHDLHLQITPVDICSVVDIVVHLSEQSARQKNLQLIHAIPQNLPLVDADENRLQQILFNLVGNAIKFTHSGMVRITAEHLPAVIQISVQDTGIGIAPEHQTKIFESFEQVDGSVSREFGGTGLGLSVTRQLVELHDGDLWVESVPGEGSSFFFTLPVSTNTSGKTKRDIRSSEKTPLPALEQNVAIIPDEQIIENLQDRLILVVDDEPVNLEVLRQQLHLNHFRVLTAADGFKALEILEHHKPDLMLLDLMMPGISGYEVASRVRQKYDSSQLPIIILTAKSKVQDLIHGYESGASDYLEKPFNKAELLARIRLHMQLKSSVEHLEDRVRERTRELDQTRTILEVTEKIASMTQTFEKFVPRQFLNRIADHGLESIELGKAESDIITVLFSDIRDFTHLSETLSPQELLNFLNAYFKRMSQPVHDNDGFIDKFIGDAMMVLFDFPESSDAHEATAAIKTAIGMQKTLKEYNVYRKKSGYVPIQTGIGIHSGNVIIGTVGTRDRMDSTVLGDVVNLASRLEGLTKLYNAQIIISSQTWRMAETTTPFLWRELDFVSVKGKDRPESIFEVFDANEERIRDLKQQILKPYHQGLMLYFSRNWTDAVDQFRECLKIFPKDTVSQQFVERCDYYRKHPPEANWNGTIRLQQKHF